jgi:hypothetical protein
MSADACCSADPDRSGRVVPIVATVAALYERRDSTTQAKPAAANALAATLRVALVSAVIDRRYR